MTEPRLKPGTEVEWVAAGHGKRRLRGRIVAFVPAGTSAWALLPEGVVERMRKNPRKQPPFNDVSSRDRYLVLVEAEAEPRYACPLAGALESQVLGTARGEAP